MQKVKLLMTTNEIKEGYPVMREYNQSEALNELINHSFIKGALSLYQEALKYTDTKENTFYLSFKKGSGCYGDVGFYLMSGDELIDKTSSAYIELDENMLREDPGYLQSITQIFPHEMGHILLKLTSERFKSPMAHSFDMHYSNVITEYSTVFNEGFAEHFEVIARKYEPDQRLKSQIVDDMKMKKKKINSILPRVKRDFNLPLRLNFYRGMAILWFNQKEAVQREELVLSGMCIYKNDYQKQKSIEKTLLYRNMGLGQDPHNKRSLAQTLSTEAVISRFFVLLEEENKLSPTQHYEKVLKVFHGYLKEEEGAPLIAFIKGYIKEYPEEKEALYKVFKDATGYEFTEQAAPEIWLVTKGEHIIIPMDSFGSAAFPLYIFNVNTCETEDLQRRWVNQKEAKKIIEFREKKGYFLNVDALKNIEGIQQSTIDLINNAYFDSSDTEKIDSLLSTDQNINIDMGNMLKAYFVHLLAKGILLFTLFFTLYSIVVIRKGRISIKDVFLQMIKFIVHLILGFVCATISMIIIIRGRTVNP